MIKKGFNKFTFSENFYADIKYIDQKYDFFFGSA